MCWTKRFLLLLPLLVVFPVFASDQKLEVVPEPENSGGGEKVLVEVTDAMEEEEEEPVVAFKPSVAPATPQVLSTASPRYIVHEAPSIAESSIKESSITSELYNNSIKMMDPSHNATSNQSPDVLSSVVVIPSLSLPDQQMSATVALPNVQPVISTVKSSDVPDEVVPEAANPVDNPIFADDDNVEVVPLDSGGGEGAPPANAGKAEEVLKEKDHLGLDSNKTVIPVEKDGIAREGKSASSEEEVPPRKEESMEKADEKTKVEMDVEIKRVHVENEATMDEGMPQVINGTDSAKPSDIIVPSEVVEEQLGDKSTAVDPVVVDPKPPKHVDEDGELKENEKMISFAKWKKEKEDVITVNQTKPTIPQNKPITKTRNKIKKNFASIDCGGKVIAANSEAQNILSVLKEDKDIYMLNPCNVKAWFVVELCDRIQVDSIDLANFEMFSSTPEVFNVYVTSRYPSGNWEKVDTFQAKNVKEVQTFGFKEVFYAKYIKLEVKKYFGSEHYCPLSLLRVFGITEVEQFEDHDEHEHGNEIEVIDEHHVEHNLGEDRKTDDKNSANIFEAAKNVVAGLVNGMASKLSGKSDLEGDDSNNSTNSAVVTVTAISEENELIEAGDNSTRYYKDSLVVGERHVDWEMWYYYRYPKHTCPLIDPKRFIKEIKATVFFKNNDPPTLASSFVNDNLVAKIVPTPYPTPLPKSAIGVENISIAVTQVILATSTVAIKEAIQTERNTAVHTSPTPTVHASVLVSEVISVTSPILPIEANVTTADKLTVDQAIPDSETADELHFNVNETVNGAVVAEKIIKNVSNPTVAPVENASTDSPSLVSLVSDENEKSVITNSVETPSLDSSHTSSTSSQDQSNTTESSSIPQVNLDHDKSSSGTSVPPSPAPTQPPNSSVKDAKQEENLVVNVNPETKSQDKKTESATEYLKIEKEIQALTAKPTSGSKESIIGKLNAKVKGLEANLTMSMMYLDEMSERYQLHVEKVDERHKKKYSALNASFQHQQELICNQSIRIDNLSKQLSDVVFQLHNLTHTTQEQHQKMIETHATWVFLEIIFILVFLLLCRSTKKGGGLSTNDEEDDPPSARRHSEPMMSRGDRSNLQRTASDPSGSALSSAMKNGGPLQHNALMGKKRAKRKKHSRSEVDLIGGAADSGCAPVAVRWMNGITEVFKRTDSNEKISRQADALIDEVSENNSSNNLLRKVRSSHDLPVIHEDYADGLQYMECTKRFNDAEFFRKCS